MKRNILFLLFCCLISVLAKAQVPDSANVFSIQEVEITARNPEKFAAGSRQTILDSAYLRLNNAASLADVLQSRTPVYQKTYGFGMLATPTFRGTSASHTAVLWNGFNINQPTLGLSDFSILPVSAISSVQIQHGSSGSNFGSGAIGGAVLLNAAAAIPLGLKVNAQQDFGSFGHVYSQVGGSCGFKNLGFDALVFHTEAANDFPFKNTAKFGAPEEKQENAHTQQTGFSGNLLYKLNARNHFTFRNWFTSSDFEAQPNMATANNHARNQNRNLRLLAAWENQNNWGTTEIRTAFFNDFMGYRDDATGVSDTEVKTWQAQAEHTFTFRNNFNLNVGADAQYFRAAVEEYGEAKTEKRASVFALFRYDFSRAFSLNLNWRQAFIEGFNPPPSPAAGFRLTVLTFEKSELSWKGNMSRGYRAPTLNDRFWPPGNATLKPENSWNYETGLIYKYNSAKITLESELTTYLMRVNNWIQWTPVSGIIWAPENLKTVEAKGLEYSAKTTFKGRNLNLTAGGNYAYTRSKQAEVYNSKNELAGKQLLYVPFHTATAFTDLTYKTWLLTINYQFTGSRFTTAENDFSLAPYALVSGYVGKTFKVKKTAYQVIGKVNNITNQVYQNLQYYAMPGRNYNLSLRFQLN